MVTWRILDGAFVIHIWVRGGVCHDICSLDTSVGSFVLLKVECEIHFDLLMTSPLEKLSSFENYEESNVIEFIIAKHGLLSTVGRLLVRKRNIMVLREDWNRRFQ